MKLIPALLLLAAAAASSANAATPSVVNFDGLTGSSIFNGELVTTQYAAQGISFSDSHAGGAHANSSLGVYLPGSSAPNILWVDQGGGSTTGQYLQISFASAVNGVQMLFLTSGNANITLAAFRGAALADSVTMTGAPQANGLLAGLIGVNDLGITSLRLSSLSSGTSFNFGIDNLSTGTVTAVPEPGTGALLAAGLAMAAVSARRRQRAAR